MHPWEDWAETWAHYLHMLDRSRRRAPTACRCARAPVGAAPEPTLRARRLDLHDFDDLMKAWIPLTVALNSMNRSFGMPDCYPFVSTDTAIAQAALRARDHRGERAGRVAVNLLRGFRAFGYHRGARERWWTFLQ